jgi:hypothetical protein
MNETKSHHRKSLMAQPPWWLCLLIVLIAVGYVLWQHTPSNRFPSAALQALRQDDHAVLYSLEPNQEMNPDSPRELLHRYPVLGKTELSSARDREMLETLLEDSTHGVRDAAACFEPRHALRIKGPQGTYDLLLCYSCGHARVYLPDGTEQNLLIKNKLSENTQDDARSALKVLNTYLVHHGIPLPEN